VPSGGLRSQIIRSSLLLAGERWEYKYKVVHRSSLENALDGTDQLDPYSQVLPTIFGGTPRTISCCSNPPRHMSQQRRLVTEKFGPGSTIHPLCLLVRQTSTPLIHSRGAPPSCNGDEMPAPVSGYQHRVNFIEIMTPLLHSIT